MTNVRWLCSVCHVETEWRTCWECDGEGYSDSYDDICPICDGDGGWRQCPNHHNASEPEKVEEVQP